MTGDARPTVPEVWPLVRAYYAIDGNSVGGNLHIVLEDGNIKDDDVQWCLDNARERGDASGVELAELLLKMTKTQRTKLSRMKKR